MEFANPNFIAELPPQLELLRQYYEAMALLFRPASHPAESAGHYLQIIVCPSFEQEWGVFFALDGQGAPVPQSTHYYCLPKGIQVWKMMRAWSDGPTSFSLTSDTLSPIVSSPPQLSEMTQFVHATCWNLQHNPASHGPQLCDGVTYLLFLQKNAPLLTSKLFPDDENPLHTVFIQLIGALHDTCQSHCLDHRHLFPLCSQYATLSGLPRSSFYP